MNTARAAGLGTAGKGVGASLGHGLGGGVHILMDYEREQRKRGGRSAGHRSRRSVRSEKNFKRASLH